MNRFGNTIIISGSFRWYFSLQSFLTISCPASLSLIQVPNWTSQAESMMFEYEGEGMSCRRWLVLWAGKILDQDIAWDSSSSDLNIVLTSDGKSIFFKSMSIFSELDMNFSIWSFSSSVLSFEYSLVSWQVCFVSFWKICGIWNPTISNISGIIDLFTEESTAQSSSVGLLFTYIDQTCLVCCLAIIFTSSSHGLRLSS